MDISIIIPVYRVERFLRRCIDSVLGQDFAGTYEIILVNDGSPDNSGAICDEYAQKYNSVKVVHKENGGLSSARMAGVKVAEGDYIMSVDSDDYISPHMMSHMYSAVKETGADIGICAYNTVLGDNIVPHLMSGRYQLLQKVEIYTHFVEPLIGDNPHSVVDNLTGFFSGKIYLRTLLTDDCFVSEREYYAEDIVLNLMIAPKLKRIAIINEPLYYYVYNSQSLTESYRSNAWYMRTNLYQFIVDYVKQHKLQCDIRLRSHLRGAVTYSIMNAVRASEYSQFIKEYNEIKKTELCKKALKEVDYSEMKRLYSIMFTLLRVNMPRLIYHYFKWRMKP